MLRYKIFSILALCFLGISACEDEPEYKELSFMETTHTPYGYHAYVDAEEIVIPAGIVQAIKAEVEYKGDRYLRGSFVDLASRDNDIFGVLSMGKKNEFLLMGRTPGQTCMEVTVNGTWEECIDVTVE